MAYRYGAWRGGPDPLAPPFDARSLLDELGTDVLDGASPREALRALLRRGSGRMRGLDSLRRQVRERMRETRDRGRLDGTLEEVRRLLDRALELERQALFPDPSDAARLAESELDGVPADTARAVRQLADYPWRSPAAAQAYAEIRDLLRREVLDAQFHGLKDMLRNGSAQDVSRVRDMLADLNAMLDADAAGADTAEAFQQFMDDYGDLFPEAPESLEELVDVLARRAAAASRLMASLTPDQRAELSSLLAAALDDADLRLEMDRLAAALRGRRPDLGWDARERMTGDEPLGVGDATTALADLADLGDLDAALRQDYAGASLEDVDADALARAVGQRAVDDLGALRAVERELAEQGYLARNAGELELTPKAVRRLGSSALARIFGS
ncbi:MAG: hypothetical protein ABR520_07255, partial [Mycobacteriales bacterium]